MLKKLGLMLFLLAVFLLNAKSANAYYEQGTGGGVGGSAPIMGSWEDAVYGKPDEFNLQSSTNETFKNLVVSATQAIIGPENPEYQTMAGHGAIASVGNLIAGMYSNPPASSVTYFADVLHNLGLAKPVYAQGVGFSGMSNLLPLWKASRNLAYILFIVAFLYIGLAIMFRVKISPQAIVTIQSALPKLIIALILVTFSYAIVGLMIDLIYVIIYVGILAIGQTGWIEEIGSSVVAEQAKYSGLTFWQGVGLVIGGGTQAITGLLGGFVGVAVLEGILALLGSLLPGGIGLVIPALPVLIIGIIALFCIFKLFLSLIGSYIGIIISLITAPLQIMIGVLPGSQAGFGSWFKNLMANILVFPAVALAMLIGWLLTTGYRPSWTPPVISASGNALTGIIGFGMLLLLPKIPDIIKNAFKIKPAGYGKAIGEAFGPVTPIYKAGASALITSQEQREGREWIAGALSAVTGIRGGGGRRTGKTSAGQPES